MHPNAIPNAKKFGSWGVVTSHGANYSFISSSFTFKSISSATSVSPLQNYSINFFHKMFVAGKIKMMVLKKNKTSYHIDDLTLLVEFWVRFLHFFNMIGGKYNVSRSNSMVLWEVVINDKAFHASNLNLVLSGIIFNFSWMMYIQRSFEIDIEFFYIASRSHS